MLVRRGGKGWGGGLALEDAFGFAKAVFARFLQVPEGLVNA